LQATVRELLSAKRDYFHIHHFGEHSEYSYLFGFVMNIPNQELAEMVVVNVLSHYFLIVCFCEFSLT
jgi:ABC-type Mn2+/Zn2+ transport system permease subunit